MFLELRHLLTLATLRDVGSVSEAAERLHLTQSALSHQLKALELHFGGPLFVRKTRPLKFTRSGQRLLELADHVLPAVAATERDLKRLVDGGSGRLFMALECHSCFDWLMPAMDHYRDQWPDVEMDVSIGFGFDPQPALVRGDIDLVITSDPQDLSGIRYQPLFRYEVLLVTPVNHPLTARAWIKPDDLEGETLITYPVDRDRLDIYARFLDPAGIKAGPQRTAELTAMILQLVASQRGLAALPNWVLSDYLSQGYVAARPLGRRGLWRTLLAAIRKEEAELPYLHDFIETARQSSFRSLADIKSAGTP